MEKTDKSAEDDFREIIELVKLGANINLKSRFIHLSNSIAAQQLSEYKEVIKELLPFARGVVYNTSINTEEGRKNVREIQAIIDRAKKLIEK